MCVWQKFCYFFSHQLNEVLQQISGQPFTAYHIYIKQLKVYKYMKGSFGLTFPFQEVEGAQEATCSGYFRFRISCELGKLFPWKINESSDIAEYQISEDLRMLMSQPLHKEVWVKDHRLASTWLFLADKHTAFSPPVKESEEGWFGFDLKQ